MTEHAFDPTEPNEPTAPNATVTLDQVEEAIASGRWTHDVPGTELWLNTSFPPVGREASELIVELAAYGVVVVE